MALTNRFNLIAKYIVESRAIISFFVLFSPLIISLFLMFYGSLIGFSSTENFEIIGILYPYLQLIFWIYWICYSVKRLSEMNEIDSKYSEKYSRILDYSKIIFFLIVFTLFVSYLSLDSKDFPEIIIIILKYIGYGISISQLYLFFAWIYGFWLVTKTLNDIYEINGKEREMSMVIFFFLPFTYGMIHRKIKKELKLN